MAADWFIDFDKDKAPSKEDLGKALEDFLGAFATEIHWEEDRWFATLTGTQSWPLRRLENENSLGAQNAAQKAGGKRWIEVWLDHECVDVMTRQGDWATNTLAGGFADLVAQYWQGNRRLD